MSTSGSIDFSVNRDDVITEALEIIGVLGEGESPNASQLTSCARTLNMMVKNWQVEGLNLFTLQRQYLFLETDKVEYSLSSSGDNFTTSYVKTQIATAASSGASSIEVDSITGISNGDYIGVELDDGTMQWTTVNGAPSGTTVALSATLTDDVAVDNYVFTYTTKANRPMQIVRGVVRNTSDVDINVEVIDRTEYVDLTNKTSEGQPNQIWYDKQVGAGKLFVWPEPDDVTEVLVLWAQRTIEDFDASTDDVDFPQEWYLPLSFGLASLLSHKYGLPAGVMDRIAVRAKALKDDAMAWDREDSVFFMPAYEGRG